MKSLDERRNLTSSKSSILDWQRRSFNSLQQLRDSRCAQDERNSSIYLPILAFYMDHTLLVVNTYAARDLLTFADHAVCPDCLAVFQQTLTVAMHLIDLLLFDRLLLSIAQGFHNMQLVMISHAAIEILNTLKRGWQLEETDRAVDRLRFISAHMERTSDALPGASYAKLYLEMFRLLALQLDGLLTAMTVAAGEAVRVDPSMVRMGGVSRWANGSASGLTAPVDEFGFDLVGGLDLSLFGLGSAPLEETTWDFGSGFIPSEFR